MNNTPTVAPYLTGIAAKLQDPVVVHAAMLRGEIAKPAIRDMLHLYGADALARWDAQGEPVAWIEAESCAAGLPAIEVVRGLTCSSRWHFQSERPAPKAGNILLAIYAAPTLQAAVPVGHYTPEKLRSEAAAREVAP